MSTELEAYYAEAASWDADRAAQTVRRLRLAWVIAGAGWLCGVCGCIALVVLMPLKRTEPYVIRVDNSTGIVDVVPMYAGGEVEFPEAVTRYFLTHYVTICEGYDAVTAERDWQECGAYHTSKRNQEWYSLWNPVNPNSPLNLYKDGSTVRAQVTAVSFFTRASGLNSLAQVRYTEGKRPPGGTETITHWIATIEYAYVAPSRDAKNRQWNPLGFRIVDFKTEPETAADATATLSDPTSRGSK